MGDVTPRDEPKNMDDNLLIGLLHLNKAQSFHSAQKPQQFTFGSLHLVFAKIPTRVVQNRSGYGYHKNLRENEFWWKFKRSGNFQRYFKGATHSNEEGWRHKGKIIYS